jgi:glucose-6-phosphate isomerase
MTPALPDKLRSAARTLAGTPLADLFARDPSRVERLTIEAEGFRADLSKERLTPEALAGLCEHARDAGLPAWIAALFAGEKVNVSEKRPALHPRMRDDANARRASRAGAWRRWPKRCVAASGVARPARRSATSCTSGSADRTSVRGSSSTRSASPATTAPWRVVRRQRRPGRARPRARAARPGDDAVRDRLQELHRRRRRSPTRTRRAHGSPPDCRAAPTPARTSSRRPRIRRGARVRRPDASTLPFPEGVGGRFSLWSSVGVTIAAASATTCMRRCSPARTRWTALSHGARRAQPAGRARAGRPVERERHRLPAARRRPVCAGARAAADLPPAAIAREQRQARHARRLAGRGPHRPALWGGVGTDGQHAFFQWLHQGTDVVPVEFIVPAAPVRGDRDRHALLVANALAQAQALAFGRATPDAARASPGDRPSTTLVTPALDARTLGALLALYEHRTFVEGILWGINPFDQFGVELGKILAGRSPRRSTARRPRRRGCVDACARPATSRSKRR